MARPADTARIVFSGHLAQGERFAWGFWMDESPTSQQAAMDEALTLADYWTTYGGNNLANLMSADCAYEQVDVYGYPAGGPAGAAYHGVHAIANGAGTTTAANHPLQVAIVVTLHTATPGASYRGRFFLPLNDLELTAHQLSGAQTTALAEDVRQLLQAINDSGAGIPGRICVVSPTKGVKTVVNSISVDSRLDVQRRRAEDETELFNATEVLVS